MCTTRFSGRHGGGVEGGGSVFLGDVCLEGMSAKGGVSRGVCPGGCTPWTQRQTPPILHAGIHTPCPCILGYNLPPPWTEGMTHACENITLPQTSFADGNKMR